MSSETKNMNLAQKISLTISVLTFVVGFVGLTLSDSVSDLIEKVDIVVIQDSIKLDGLAESDGYINTLNLRNRGNASSTNMILIVDFESKMPDYNISSDEDLGETDISGNRLRVRMDRLSINSSLSIKMFSKFPISYEASYIDDSGNHKLYANKDTAQRSLVDMILLLIVIISLLIIVWICRKASENALIETLQNHQNEIQDRLREVRDEIGNIEVVVKDSPNSVTAETEGNDKGFSQRLSDFMNKI
ncbi:hypothetical protein [Halomonas sp. GT]|uniref:hypothetical protein n=1 Tax=Halomonas sp. GT TaxID=1971364 RepID=UPI0009F22530|nr:hypothetical protein [Halomonas sp. GT]